MTNRLPARAALRLIMLLPILVLLVPPAAVRAQETVDPYLWLEEVEGQRAMEWVLARSAETAAELTACPGYETLFRETLNIITSAERIAYPQILGEHLYNFWTDADHPRGIWRRTSWEAYLAGSPEWERVLDMDALAEAEGVPWSFHGATSLYPEERFCLVNLSRGGSDAVEVREFDLNAGTFVPAGFQVPESKNSLAWVDRNTLLVATALYEENATTSGYARTACLWRRNTPLETARTILEADPADMGVFVGQIEAGGHSYALVQRMKNFYSSETYLFRNGALVRVEIPEDAYPLLVGDQLVVQLVSDWMTGGRTFPQGAVVSIALEAFLAGDRDLEIVVAPGPRSTVEGVSATRDHLLVSVLEEVQGQLWRYRREEGRWIGERIPAPGLGAVSVAAASPHGNRFFFTYNTFLQPTTLYLGAADGTVREVRRMPAMFDADGLTVEQYQAVSPDGTRIPYFVVRPEGLEMNGRNPTLLYAYGGFQVSETPSYDAVMGRAWLERGNVYVLANIRGGGEFGPAWWRSALKENRQRAYDDFLAVARDLVERGITSPDHLGIMGGSNGGLLVGAAMTQRPDLFGAVVIQVPLLDMRRYHTLLAGASWMAEYGNPDVPEEWAYISRYSPYQNVRAGVDYPRAFFFTTTRDDRVHPGHARKMAAKMIDLGQPVYYFENTEGGHGAGVTPEQRAQMWALTYTYLRVRLEGPTSR